MLGSGGTGRTSPRPLPAGFVGGAGPAAGVIPPHAHGHKRKAGASVGVGVRSSVLSLPHLSPAVVHQHQQRQQRRHGLMLLTEVMREALGVLQLVEETRQDEALGLGLELKELSRLVTAAVAVCQQALQGLTAQLLALLDGGVASSSHSSRQQQYAAPAAAAAAAAAAAPMPAAAAAPMPPAGAYYGHSSRNAPSPEPRQPYMWGTSGVELQQQQQQPAEAAPDAGCLEYLLVRRLTALVGVNGNRVSIVD